MSKHIMTYQFGKPGQDQRLDHREDGVYVFDWSGDSPETCEDGPLRAIENTAAELSMFHDTLEVSVAVWSVRQERQYRCSMSLRCFQQLAQLVPGLTLTRDHRYRKVSAEILKAEALAIELEGKQ